MTTIFKMKYPSLKEVADDRHRREAFMYDWQVSESGRAVETALFGGWTGVINSRIDSLHRLRVVDWPGSGFKDRARRGQTEIWRVPMEFVNNLFRERY